MAFLDETGVQNLTSDIKTLADQTYLPKNTTIPSAGTELPLLDSYTYDVETQKFVGNSGTSTKYAREDHSHPTNYICYVEASGSFLTWLVNKQDSLFSGSTLNKYGLFGLMIGTSNYTDLPSDNDDTAYGIVNFRNGRIYVEVIYNYGNRYWNSWNGTRWTGWNEIAKKTQIDDLNDLLTAKTVAVTTSDTKISTIDAWRTGNVLQLNFTIAALALSAGWNSIQINGLTNLMSVPHRISGSISLGGSGDASKVFHVRLESSQTLQLYASQQNSAQIFVTINAIIHN